MGCRKNPDFVIPLWGAGTASGSSVVDGSSATVSSRFNLDTSSTSVSGWIDMLGRISCRRCRRWVTCHSLMVQCQAGIEVHFLSHFQLQVQVLSFCLSSLLASLFPFLSFTIILTLSTCFFTLWFIIYLSLSFAPFQAHACWLLFGSRFVAIHVQVLIFLGWAGKENRGRWTWLMESGDGVQYVADFVHTLLRDWSYDFCKDSSASINDVEAKRVKPTEVSI